MLRTKVIPEFEDTNCHYAELKLTNKTKKLERERVRERERERKRERERERDRSSI